MDEEYDDILDMPISGYTGINVDSYNEMATVGRSIESKGDNFLVVVTPDSGRNDAYFKVCNHQSYTSSTKVIRIAFKKPEAYLHKGDGKEFWEIDGKMIKKIIGFMKSKPKGKHGDFDTNWELAIYLWNIECGFESHPDYDEGFPEGCDQRSELYHEPQFVPLNTEMPDYTKLKI